MDSVSKEGRCLREVLVGKFGSVRFLDKFM